MPTLSRRELDAVAVHDVIRGRTLREHGASRQQVRTMLGREHLFVAHKDVFFTTDRPTREGRWLAAVWHCGKGARRSGV
jgi:hypothetical protein